MAKRTIVPKPTVTPYQQRVLERLLRQIVGQLADFPDHTASEVAALLVDRLRNHYHLGGKSKWPSSSSRKASNDPVP